MFQIIQSRLKDIIYWQINVFSYFRLKSTDLDPKKVQPEKIPSTCSYGYSPFHDLFVG